MKPPRILKVRHAAGQALKAESGAAAVEFAIWLIVIAYPLLNAFDLGLYVFRRMEVQNAAQMALQSAFNTCAQKYSSPVFSKCNAANSNAGAGTAAVTAGAQSTSLVGSVSVTDKSECVDGVVTSGTQTSCPTSSGDYLGVTVSYTFAPLFRAASITSLLATTVQQSHWTRMS